MKYAEIEKIDFPIVVFRFNPVEVTVNEYINFLQDQINVLKQYPGAVFVFDLTKSKPLPSELRILQGNWTKKHLDLLKSHLKGIVFVNQSVFMNFVLKGIFLVQKPPVPYTVATTVNEGLAWAKGLAQHKVLA